MACETERKWLIVCPQPEELEGAKVKEIRQVYLPVPEGWDEHRVRKAGTKTSGYKYTETKKRRITAVTREEAEREISEAEYLVLSKEGVSQIHKTRYVFEFAGQCFELDIYFPHGCNGYIWDGEAILELELQYEEQVVNFPDWISVIREVTSDPNYKNKNLAYPI